MAHRGEENGRGEDDLSPLLLGHVVAGDGDDCEDSASQPGQPPQAGCTKVHEDGVGDFVAAGVLPFARSPGGKVIFLLGKELSKGPAGRNKYVWSDFGGKREGLHESAHQTACREFSEETLGLWGGMGTLSERIGRSYDTLQAMLSPPEASRGSAAFTIKNGLYINFLVEMPYLDPLLFQLARDDNDASLPCAVPGSAAIRAAEKRDWTWVDSLEVMDRVEGGSCRVRDLSGERIHLLPRLALTLRAYLRSVIGSIRSGSLPGAMLLVPLQSASRCLHLFGVRSGLTEADMRAKFSKVLTVTAYADRTGQPNVFVLFEDCDAASKALESLRERQGEGANVWDEGAAASVEFAWFEGVGEDERKGDGKTVHFRKKHASRMRKLGVGFPTAPWAKKKVPGKV